MKPGTVELLYRALAEELEARKAGLDAVRRAAERPGPWCTREQATRYFAIPKGRLEQWVAEGKVIAKKFDATCANSAIRFKTADIDAAYEAMPNYKPKI